MPGISQAHYQGSYRGRAARVREQAYADPMTRCWRCGLLLDEVPGSRWQAGHTVDGDPLAPLLAEHSRCNASAGARAGNARRALNASRVWF